MKAAMIIALLNMNGVYVDKVVIHYPDMKSCERAAKHIEGMDTHRPRTLCVTLAHWQGKDISKDTPLD